MTLTLARYRVDQMETWDRFVEDANGGTIFHRQDFLAYHGARFADSEHHLMWLEGGTVRAVMPMALVDRDGVLIARSPYGASYGGIIAGAEFDLESTEAAVGLLVEYLRDHKAERLEVTFPPGIYYNRATDYFPFFLLKRGGQVVNSDLTAFIPLSECTSTGYTRACRKAMRKGVSDGIAVRQSDDVDAFYEILLKNRGKFGATPTHSRSEVAWLLAHHPDRVALFLAYLEDEPVAGTLVFKCNDRVLLDFYWAHLEEFQSHRPVNVLVHEVAEWGRGHGLRYFDFGTQTSQMVPNYGGSRFKESFGSTGVFRHTLGLDV